MADFVDITQLDAAKQRFTDLGVAVEDLSKTNSQLFDETFRSIGHFSSAVGVLVGSEEFKKASRLVNLSDQYVANVAGQYSSMSKNMEKSFDKLDSTVDAANENFGKLSGDAVDLLQMAQEAGVIKSDEDKSKEKKSWLKRELTGLARAPLTIMDTELSSFWNNIKGMLGSLKIPLPGGVLSGIVNWMKAGFLDKDRVRAEAGEMQNILVAAYDGGLNAATRAATRNLSGLQEHLQQYYGIHKSETQGVTKAFVDGGVAIERIEQRVGITLKGVESTTQTVSHALDLMFELPGGTSARRMVDYMAKYALTTDEAREAVTDLYMEGREGIGQPYFVRNVEAAAESLAGLGYNIRDVMDLAKTLGKAYEDMGVPKQFAGRVAAEGLQQLAAGIAQMGNDWAILVGERLGHGEGIRAAQSLKDALQRALNRKDTNRFLEVAKTLFQIALDATGGDETYAREFLEAKFGYEGARAMAKLYNLAKEGKMVEAAKATEESMGVLAKSFQLEQKKTSQFEIMMNIWNKGIAKLGQGLLSLAVETLAWLIAFFKSIPDFLSNILRGDFDKNVELMSKINNLYGMKGEHRDKMSRGVNQMAAAAKSMGMDILGSSLKNVQSAWAFDPSAPVREGDRGAPPAPGSFAGVARGGIPEQELPRQGIALPGGMWQPSQPTVRPVTMPLVDLATAQPTRFMPQVTIPVSKERRESPGFSSDYWVGGGINLEVSSVDQEGNITVGIVGNCPRCGFVFGAEAPEDRPLEVEKGIFDKDYQAREVEALARMLETETVHKAWGEEAEVIGWTLLNRVKKELKKGKSGDIYDILTRGAGYGKQGQKRPYATTHEASPESLRMARRLLGGEVEDPTQGGTHFYHAARNYVAKQSVKAGMDPTRPLFAQGDRMVNVMNLPSNTPGAVLRVYSRRGEEAEDAQQLNRKYQRIYKARQAAPRVVMRPEDEAKGGASQFAAQYMVGGKDQGTG